MCIRDSLHSNHRKKVEIIKRAYSFAKEAHKGIHRRSGEPYILHPVSYTHLACAMIRTEMDSMPTELDVINRKIIQMQIEEAALKNEDDELSKARLTELQKELAEQRETFNSMKAKWENEKNAIGRVPVSYTHLHPDGRQVGHGQQSPAV